ncbi:hypothetical protein ACFVVC_07635 [Pseudarthrobacter sp. NPDC058196]|uniref:hypothetical protein n=1 Tax=Pseudarthrobacter sp. NPDC058196 TaxID=3346376 RepID=UPI0036D92F26
MGMTSRGDEGFLGYDGVVSDCDWSLIMDPNAFADPTPVTNTQLPREFHARSGTKYDSVPNCGSKQPQDSNAKF